jgi:hypothetical protein
MMHLILLFALLIPQFRAPSTLRAPATPPDEGTGKFEAHTYTFRRDGRQFVLEYTPALPRRAAVLAAMKEACQHLYDLDFSKSTPRPGPAPDEWLVELKDLRVCYVRQGPAMPPGGEVKTLRVWMP